MENVIVELTTLIARAETEAIDSTLEPVRPDERVRGELDLQGRAVFAAQQVALMSFQAYIKDLGTMRPDGVFIFSKHITPEQMKQIMLMKTKFNLLHALFMHLLTKMLSGPDLERNLEVRKGYKLVYVSANINDSLLTQAEDDLRAGKTRLQ